MADEIGVICFFRLAKPMFFLFPVCIQKGLMVWLQDFICEFTCKENHAGSTS